MMSLFYKNSMVQHVNMPKHRLGHTFDFIITHEDALKVTWVFVAWLGAVDS